MRNFALGVILTLIVFAAISYILLQRGYVDIRADIAPSRIETKVAGSAVDASAERHGPVGDSPVPATEDNLMAGVKLYQEHCSICHGEPSEHNGKLNTTFYPPVPKFVEDMPMDMTANQDFYIIKHGIRLSGMPAWGDKLTDEDIWKLSAFLSHMHDLPPAVAEQWNKPNP